MRAALRRLHSPDVRDLNAWTPHGHDFSILVQLLVGPDGDVGEESFDITLCTPGWLADQVYKYGILDARHHLVVDSYDYDRIETYLRNRVSELNESSWEKLAAKLGRLGRWEFEDYRGPTR